MRTPGQIWQKLKQVQYRHLKKEIKRLLKQTSRNCKHQKMVETRGGESGICTLDCAACDTWVDRASDCGQWEPKYTASGVKESLKEFFRTRKVPEIAVRFPDVAALLWVLEEEGQDGPLLIDGYRTASLYGMDLWVDTKEDLDALEEIAQEYDRDREAVDQLSEGLKVPPEEVVKSVQELREELDRTKHVLELLKGRNRDLFDSNEELQKIVDGYRSASAMLQEPDLPTEDTDTEEPGAPIVEAPPWWKRWLPWAR